MAYGPPPGGQPPYGAPPAPGFAPNPYGQAPQGYGQPMGPPPGMGPMGQPPAGMAPYGQQAGAIAQAVGVGTLQSAGVSAGPKRRNALMTWLMPIGVMFGGMILSIILAFISPSLATLGSLVTLGGAVWYLILTIQMANELKSVTRNQAFAWWPIFIPIYSLYWLWFLVPQEVSRAKQMNGVQAPTRSIILYIFLFHFALASDLNDLAR
jgi:hypothetical protein